MTGDASFQAYTFKNFDFIFEHLPYFRQQAKLFGPQSYGYRRLIEMRELDDCGSIGAALIKTYARKPDPKYKEGIELAASAHPHEAAAPAGRHAGAPPARCRPRSGSTTPT